MNRHVLASQALTASRGLLAQVPVPVRIASLVEGFLREALSAVAELQLTIGLQALIAMEHAGTPGNIEGHTIEELRPLIKRNALSKLQGIARALGGKIFSISIAGKRNKIQVSLLEDAWMNYASTLERNPLAPDKNVGQAIHYLAEGFTLRIKDALSQTRRREEIRANPEVGEGIHVEHFQNQSESALWKEIEHKFKSNPELLGPKGEPWAWIYVEGKAGGMSEEQIIDQWNEASRRSGGEGGITRPSFVNWLRAVKRRALMIELTKSYLDEATVKRLKLAASRGALDTTLLLPFERDLLELLVA